MRIAIISPHFPPLNSGVGDYAYRLSSQLAEEGHEVCVWTELRPTNDGGAFKIASLTTPLSNIASDKLIGEIKSFGAEKVIVQFTPSMYLPRPWSSPFGLLNLCRHLKADAKVQSVLMVHEARYPIQASFKGALYGLSHFAVFSVLIHLFDKVVFSYDTILEEWSSRFPHLKKYGSWCPVGTTLDVAKYPEPKNKKTNEDELLLVHFGGRHPTHLVDHSLMAYTACKKEIPERSTRLVFIGIEEKDLLGLSKLYSGMKNDRNILVLGYLPSNEVLDWISSADALLAPYYDGISTRRTSAMVGFALGIPVITNREYLSGKAVPWEEFCVLDKGRDPDSFAALLVSFLMKPVKERNQLGALGKNYFENQFSWSALANFFVQL